MVIVEGERDSVTAGGAADQEGGGMNLEEEKFRIRWRRWLGNKTAKDGPYWTTLLDSKWSCWCDRVCRNHRINNKMEWTRESVKGMYRLCIDIATMEELTKLDGLYAWDRWGSK